MAKFCPQCNHKEDGALLFCPRDGAALQDRDNDAQPATHAPDVPPESLVGAPVAAAHGSAPAADEAEERHAATMMLVLPEGGIEALRSQLGGQRPAPTGQNQTAHSQTGAAPAPTPARARPPTPVAPARPATAGAAVPAPRPVPPARPAPAVGRPTTPAIGIRPGAEAPPKPAPVALPGASSLRDVFTKDGLSVERSVLLLEVVARSVAAQRGGSSGQPHGALTPEHVRFDRPKAGGKVTIVAPDALPLDPQTLAYYRAPEYDQNTITAQTEVYALACMLFEAITGRPPFRTGTPDELKKRHAGAAPPAVRQVRKDCDLPPALELEINRALKKRPGDRHASPDGFAEAIAAAVRDDNRATMALQLDSAQALALMGSLTGDGQTAATSASKQQQQVPAPAMEVPPPAKSKTGLFVGLGVAALALGAGAFFALSGDPQPPAAPAQSVDAVAAPAPAAAADAEASLDAAAATDVAAETDTAAESDMASASDAQTDDTTAEPKSDPRRPRPVHRGKPGDAEPKLQPAPEPDTKPKSDPNRPVTF